MNLTEQQFFDDLEKKLWTAANKLLPSLDAAVYKHIVLGLLFIKYVSDAFEERQKELKAQFQDPAHDYYMNPADYPGTYDTDVAAELEVRDYYTEKNVFWVPPEARWLTLRDLAKLRPGAAARQGPERDSDGRYERQDHASWKRCAPSGWLIDNAMEAVERENPKLKNVLEQGPLRSSQLPSQPSWPTSSAKSFSNTNFHANPNSTGQPLDLNAKDILGHVYEYFLGQFALAEGKKGGQYYTPKGHRLRLIVAMLQPFKGRVYDPAMGSGGFFVQSERIHRTSTAAKVAGQGSAARSASTARRATPPPGSLAAMNMAIRGMDFNFGGKQRRHTC